MIDFPSCTTLTFDFHGTIVDWESSVLPPLRSIADRVGARVSDEAILARFSAIDEQIIGGAYAPYTATLRWLTREFARQYDADVTDGDGDAVVDAVATAPPFHESIPVLRRLAERYRPVVISNTDDAIIARTVEPLGDLFDLVVTSEQARAYKPDLRIFQTALDRIGEPPERVLHVAEWFAEAGPARALGMGSVCVRRTAWANLGYKATPDLVVTSLTELAAVMGVD